MNKKSRFLFSFFLVCLVFMSFSLVLAQTEWDVCEISAYGLAVNFDDFSSSTSNQDRYEFTVANPPEGSNITNTIFVMDSSSGQNYTINLEEGQRVLVNYQTWNPSVNFQTPADDPDYLVILYDGGVEQVAINSVDVPEFAPFLIAPMFIVATLMAIIYSRKRTK